MDTGLCLTMTNEACMQLESPSERERGECLSHRRRRMILSQEEKGISIR